MMQVPSFKFSEFAKKFPLSAFSIISYVNVIKRNYLCDLSSVNSIIVNRKFHVATAIAGDCGKIDSIVVKSHEFVLFSHF